jgi:hypothetical protein
MKVLDKPTIRRAEGCADTAETIPSGEKKNNLGKYGVVQIRIVSRKEAAAISKKTSKELKAVREDLKKRYGYLY